MNGIRENMEVVGVGRVHGVCVVVCKDDELILFGIMVVVVMYRNG